MASPSAGAPGAPFEQPTTQALAAALEPGLVSVLRFFRSRIFEAARARGLTQAQYNALRYLSKGPERRMRELAEHLELTNGACTALVDRLVERGSVERREDAADKRAVLVALLPAGQDEIALLLKSARAEIESALGRLSPAERYMAVGGVLALASAIEGLFGEASLEG